MRGVVNNKGQVTVFIIIALVVVVGGILFYTLSPNLKGSLGFDNKNPEAYIQDCIEDDFKDLVETISLQGGELEPTLYHLYLDEKINYLCHTPEDNKFCAVQIPFLKPHVEIELLGGINEKIDSCFISMKDNFEKKGYDVSLTKGERDVEILPERILLSIKDEFVATKDSTEKYEDFSVVLNNNLYELLAIATSIVDKEAVRYGDTETLTYMMLYDDLKVEKERRPDDTKIYILTNKKTGDMFQFASRSMAAPEGLL